MDPLLTDIDPSVAEGDEEQSGAYYRCRDDIENFRLKVRVSLLIFNHKKVFKILQTQVLLHL